MSQDDPTIFDVLDSISSEVASTIHVIGKINERALALRDETPSLDTGLRLYLLELARQKAMRELALAVSRARAREREAVARAAERARAQVVQVATSEALGRIHDLLTRAEMEEITHPELVALFAEGPAK